MALLVINHPEIAENSKNNFKKYQKSLKNKSLVKHLEETMTI